MEPAKYIQLQLNHMLASQRYVSWKVFEKHLKNTLNDFVVFCLLFYRVKNIEIYNHDLMSPYIQVITFFQNLIEIKNEKKRQIHTQQNQ